MPINPLHGVTSKQWLCLFNPKMPVPSTSPGPAPDLPSQWGNPAEAVHELLHAILLQVKRNLFAAKPGATVVPVVGAAASQRSVTGTVELSFSPESGRSLIVPFFLPRERLDNKCGHAQGAKQHKDNFQNFEADQSWSFCGRTVSQLEWRSWPTEPTSHQVPRTAGYVGGWKVPGELHLFDVPHDPTVDEDVLTYLTSALQDSHADAAWTYYQMLLKGPAEPPVAWFQHPDPGDRLPADQLPTCKALAHRLRFLAGTGLGCGSGCACLSLIPPKQHKTIIPPCLQTGDELLSATPEQMHLVNLNEFAPSSGRRTATGRQLCMMLSDGDLSTLKDRDERVSEALRDVL